MSVFISIVIFCVALYLFFITNNKIKNIKENVVIEDSKKELESLITAFNGAAARNIELLETKITDLQDLLQKANQKMIQMDEKVDRVNRPIVVEKIVEKKEVPHSPKRSAKQTADKTQSHIEEAPIVKKEQRKTMIQPQEAPSQELSRSEQLKLYIQEGKSREELISMGYMENEINLLSFLIRQKG